MEQLYTNACHGAELAEKLAELWSTGKYCDTVLCVKDKKIKAHSIVLLASCPELMKVFPHSENDGKFEFYLTKSYDGASVQQFVRYLYEGAITLTRDNIRQVEKLAETLCVEKLVDYSKLFRAEYAAETGVFLQEPKTKRRKKAEAVSLPSQAGPSTISQATQKTQAVSLISQHGVIPPANLMTGAVTLISQAGKNAPGLSLISQAGQNVPAILLIPVSKNKLKTEAVSLLSEASPRTPTISLTSVSQKPQAPSLISLTSLKKPAISLISQASPRTPTVPLTSASQKPLVPSLISQTSRMSPAISLISQTCPKPPIVSLTSASQKPLAPSLISQAGPKTPTVLLTSSTSQKTAGVSLLSKSILNTAEVKERNFCMKRKSAGKAMLKIKAFVSAVTRKEMDSDSSVDDDVKDEPGEVKTEDGTCMEEECDDPGEEPATSQVPPKHVRRKNRQYPAAHLMKAYEDVLNKKLTVQEASRVYSIPSQTLRDRINGRVDANNPICGVGLLFTVDEERRLARFIHDLADIGYCFLRMEVTLLASQYAVVLGKREEDHILSHKWLYPFVIRWEEANHKRPKTPSEQRSHASSAESGRCYLEKLGSILEENNLKNKPQNLYMLDEHVVGQSCETPSKSPSSTTTVVGCGSAVGCRFPPFFVFSGARMQDQLLDGATPGTQGTVSTSGHATQLALLEYLQHHFVPHANPGPGNPCLLLYDAHKMHITPYVVDKAADNSIILFVRPPHTSHLFQPSPDVSCLGTFPTIYSHECRKYHTKTGGIITRRNICSIACKAYTKVLSVVNLAKSFRVSGVYPLNLSVICEDDQTDSEDGTGDNNDNEATVDYVDEASVENIDDEATVDNVDEASVENIDDEGTVDNVDEASVENIDDEATVDNVDEASVENIDDEAIVDNVDEASVENIDDEGTVDNVDEASVENTDDEATVDNVDDESSVDNIDDDSLVRMVVEEFPLLEDNILPDPDQ